jgi:hypothetical protein
MRSPNDFIVRPLGDKRYADTKEVDGVELIVSSDQEDAKMSNREAVVVSTPINYDGPVAAGDHLIVHHNVFKFYNDMRGRLRNGRSYFRDGLYFIDGEQYFMWRRPDGEWKPVGDFCFVKPVKTLDNWIDKCSDYEPLTGAVVYPNEDLLVRGVERGDRVLFNPDSEYEFRIGDDLLYRMRSSNITVKLNE